MDVNPRGDSTSGLRFDARHPVSPPCPESHGTLILSIAFFSIQAWLLPTARWPCRKTSLGTDVRRFTINKPVFLLGVSYYAALGAPKRPSKPTSTVCRLESTGSAFATAAFGPTCPRSTPRAAARP